MKKLLLVLMFVLVLTFSFAYTQPININTNCEGCCGSRPENSDELRLWFSCMKYCQDSINHGDTPDCAGDNK